RAGACASAPGVSSSVRSGGRSPPPARELRAPPPAAAPAPGGAPHAPRRPWPCLPPSATGCLRSSLSPRRPRRLATRALTTLFLLRPLHEQDLVATVFLLQEDLHHLLETRGDVLADVIGPAPQLAVSPVDQDRQLDALRSAAVHATVERRAHRASREQ